FEAGAFADVTVLRAKNGKSVSSQIVEATEDEVALVISDGIPRYGDAKLLTTANLSPSSPVSVGGSKRRFAIPDPDDDAKAWSCTDITKRRDQVRKDPAGSLKKADAKRRAYAGPMDSLEAPLELVLDMPRGILPLAGTLPKDPSKVA